MYLLGEVFLRILDRLNGQHYTVIRVKFFDFILSTCSSSSLEICSPTVLFLLVEFLSKFISFKSTR